MKLYAYFLVASSASAFTPSICGNKNVPHVLYSTTVEAPTTTKTVGRTRFDRLKETYKGLKPAIPDKDVISFTYEDFGSAVADTKYEFERNRIVEGVAVEYSVTGCLVDIGAKASAFLPINEAGLVVPENGDLSTIIPLDTPTQFQIISDEDENGQLIVSVKRIQYQKAWETLKKLAEDDQIVEAEIVAVNRGGAICHIEGLRAFLPGSHLAGQIPDETMIGNKLPVKFLEVNEETGKLVISNRKAIVEQQMEDLSRGDVVTGIVTALKPYGAFIDVGGMSGLLHISQISYDRVDDLEKVLQIGLNIKCMIIDHDKMNGRIALSTKTLEAEPGDMLRDSATVFANAEQTAAAYHARMEAERQAREDAARDIVMGLGESITTDDNNKDDESNPLRDVSDSLDSLLS